MHAFGGHDIFGAYPEVLNLGPIKLCQLCVEWQETAVAQEFAVCIHAVDPQGTVGFSIDTFADDADGEEFPVPVDDIVRFFARGLKEPARNAVLERMRQKTGISSRPLFRCEGDQVQLVRPTFLTCPKCKTTLKVRRAATAPAEDAAGPVRCPKCAAWIEVGPNDAVQKQPD
ncbi:MAG TPA: hypothetical protein VNC50_00230 [Planctomycetia bacterium]|nr:hypothetical protein [Planctomycetia bacterium]